MNVGTAWIGLDVAQEGLAWTGKDGGHHLSEHVSAYAAQVAFAAYS